VLDSEPGHPDIVRSERGDAVENAVHLLVVPRLPVCSRKGKVAPRAAVPAPSTKGAI
jgi:hypothetical protein